MTESVDGMKHYINIRILSSKTSLGTPFRLKRLKKKKERTEMYLGLNVNLLFFFYIKLKMLLGLCFKLVHACKMHC